jgi:phage gp16-like protein
MTFGTDQFPLFIKNLYFYKTKATPMQSITIDKKKYVLIEEKQLSKIQVLAAKNATSPKKLSLVEGRKMAHKLIDQWEKEK